MPSGSKSSKISGLIRTPKEARTAWALGNWRFKATTWSRSDLSLA